MHTDEYEISLTREINVCKSLIKQTQDKLDLRRQQFNMDLQQAIQAAADGIQNIDKQELADWRDDFAALSQWRQRLEEYREALASMRISASHF